MLLRGRGGKVESVDLCYTSKSPFMFCPARAFAFRCPRLTLVRTLVRAAPPRLHASFLSSSVPIPHDLLEEAFSGGDTTAKTMASDGSGSGAGSGPLIIDGKATADSIREELRARVEGMVAQYGRVREKKGLTNPVPSPPPHLRFSHTHTLLPFPPSTLYPQAPGLAVVLVGARPDSATYVRMKKKACAEAGILDLGRDLPGDATQADIVAVVQELNKDPRVDGILVQVSGMGWALAPAPAALSLHIVVTRVPGTTKSEGPPSVDSCCASLSLSHTIPFLRSPFPLSLSRSSPSRST